MTKGEGKCWCVALCVSVCVKFKNTGRGGKERRKRHEEWEGEVRGDKGEREKGREGLREGGRERHMINTLT